VTVDEIVEKLEEIGWLGHLSAAKRKRLVRDLSDWQRRDPAWTYLGLATSTYDIETIEDDGDYADLVRTYRRASNGVFDARDVESRLDSDGEQAIVAFAIGDRRFEARFSLETGDYVAEDFQPFINRCLQAVGIEQRFFTLPMVAQVAHLVFVPPAVYASAEGAGLLGPQGAPEGSARDQTRPSSGPVPRHSPAADGAWPPGPRAYLAASAIGAVIASLAGIWLRLPAALLASVVLGGLVSLVLSLAPTLLLSTRVWLYQAGFMALTLANAGLLGVNLGRGAVHWLPIQLAVTVVTAWTGTRIVMRGPAAAARRLAAIKRYCAEQGMEVPPAFGRHPGLRFVVVRTDCTPPRLSTAALFDEDGLERYIRGRMRELSAADGSQLPLRVLDFTSGHELAIGPTGDTRAASRLSPPFRP